MIDRAPFFLDTAFVVAQANARDQWHGSAARWEAWLTRQRWRLVTTEFILAEIGDTLSSRQFRAFADRIIDALVADPTIDIVPASSTLFAAARALFRARPDQAWGLTDCSSFVVMTERGLTSALTVDDHFRQAGFRTLLRDDPPD